MKRLALLAIAAVLIANEEPETAEPEANEPSEFVGRYNGSSFEMAMGMEILADGTWGWGLSVGALDMQAKGTWEQEGDFITLTSDPKPVEPEFTWSGVETSGVGREEAPFVRVVWGVNGEEFQYASTEITCRNGHKLYGQVRYDGFPSPEQRRSEQDQSEYEDPHALCDVPETVVLTQSIHRVRSDPFNLADLGWEPGRTARFEFRPNDLGVADFTGVTGYLEDGKIVLDTRALGRDDFSGPLEMRKLPPAPAPE